jgi:cation transport ATPase
MVTSNVAICMPYGGAELAKKSSEVILLKDDLSLLVAARGRLHVIPGRQ